MMTDEELKLLRERYSEWVRRFVECAAGNQPSAHIASAKTLDLVQEILANRTAPAPAADDGETVEVRLPVHLFSDDSYVCDCTNGFDEHGESEAVEVYTVTASLPRPKRREPIEVRGEVEE